MFGTHDGTELSTTPAALWTSPAERNVHVTLFNDAANPREAWLVTDKGTIGVKIEPKGFGMIALRVKSVSGTCSQPRLWASVFESA